MSTPLTSAAFEAKSPRRRRIEAGHTVEMHCEAGEAPVFEVPVRKPSAPRAIQGALASAAFDAVSPRRRIA